MTYAAAYDSLTSFSFAQDRLDLVEPEGGYRYDGRVSSGRLSTATFDTDLARLRDGVLDQGWAVFVRASTGTLAGQQFIVADVNGIDGYQAGEDLVINFSGATSPPANVDFMV